VTVPPSALSADGTADGSAGVARSPDLPTGGTDDTVTAQATEPAAQVPADARTAATALDWGTPLPTSDEFDYTGVPDPARWQAAGECWPGHDGNGRRCASLATVVDGQLRLTGLANGDTGWIRNRTDQRYGRWEARMRVTADGRSGKPYRPGLHIWPEADETTQGGSYDFAEGDVGSSRVSAFLHHPRRSSRSRVVQDRYGTALDMTEWHTYAVEWRRGHIRGYVDGVLWFDDTDRAAQTKQPMHGNVQLDNFFGGSRMQPAHMDVDWYRVYAPG
jgi:beta-glucanase (GH16 family)